MKYKSFKKMFLSVVLGMGLVVSSAAAPVYANEVPEEEITVTPDTYQTDYPILRDENGNIYDLGGMEIVVRDWWSDPNAEMDATTGYGKAKKAYLDWIQQTYHFTIKEAGLSEWGDVGIDFQDYVSKGGDDNNYIFTLRDDLTQECIDKNACYALETLDCLDFTKEKLSRNLVADLYTEDGHIYAMNYGYPEPRAGMFFNKRLLSEAGVSADEIYDLQKSGEWTWDKFEELLKKVQKDENGDGEPEIYGYCGNTSCLIDIAVHSNGGQMVGKEDGKYVLKTTSSESAKGFKFAQKIIEKYQKMGENWDSYMGFFANGEAAFLADEAYNINSYSFLSEMEDEFGFVMFPKGPDASDYTNCWANNAMVIPACYEEEKAWKIAFAWNLYTEEIPGYEDSDIWKSGYLNDASDERMVNETLAMMRKKGCVDYKAVITGFSDSLNKELLWAIGPETDMDVLLEESAEVLKPLVDKMNEKFASSRKVGDIDNNGKINRADRIYFARALAGWEGYSMPSKVIADFNRDNNVNRADRIYFARALANWDGYHLAK